MSARPAPARRSLRRNFGSVFAGNAAAALFQWLIVIAIAKCGSVTMVGEYSFALALAAPIVAFAGLQLRALQSADIRESFRFVEYLAVRLGMATLAAAVMLVCAAVLPSKSAMPIAVLGLARVVDFVADIFYGRWQQLESMGRSSVALVINSGGTLLLMTLALLLTDSLAIASLGSLGASVGALVYIALASRRVIDIPSSIPSWSRVQSLTRRAFPLGIVILLVTLQASLPRYFVRGLLGEHTLGVFAAVGQLPAAGAMVVAALGAAASPRLAALYADGRIQEYRKLLVRLVAIGVGLGIAGLIIAVVVGRPLLVALYRPEYGEAYPLLVWLCAAGVFGLAGSFLGYGMTTCGAVSAQPAVFGAALVTCAAACWIAIPRFGVSGAGVALILTGVVQCTISIRVLWRRAFDHSLPRNPEIM